jgi:carbon storage regulator
MLVFKRKLNESICVTNSTDDITIKIKIMDIDRGAIRIGVEAPREFRINREELFLERKKEHNAVENRAGSLRTSPDGVTKGGVIDHVSPSGSNPIPPPLAERGPPSPPPISRLFDDTSTARAAAASELGATYSNSPAVAALLALQAGYSKETNDSVRAEMAIAIAAILGRSISNTPDEQVVHPKSGKTEQAVAVPGHAAPLDSEAPPKVVAQRAEKGHSKKMQLRPEERLEPPEEDPKSQQPEQTVIRMEEIAEAQAEVKKLQAAVVSRVQELFDSLTGRRGESPEQNKKIAAAVYDVARNSGTELVCNGEAGTIRWHNGGFEARLTDRSKRMLLKRADFPHLLARAKTRDHEPGQGV